MTYSKVNEQEHYSRFKSNLHLNYQTVEHLTYSMELSERENHTREILPMAVVGECTGREGELDSQVNKQ